MTPHKTKKRIAVIGAGMAGITAARTLVQAGHSVAVFEKSSGCSGRMATRSSPHGSFDHGAQYFTVRDPRFATALRYALAVSPDICRPWSANAVRVLDAGGQVVAAPLPTHDAHWVAQPGMNALVRQWATALPRVELETRVTALARKRGAGQRWQLQTTAASGDVQEHPGFDAVLLAIPAPQASELLRGVPAASDCAAALAPVTTAPCLTLMLAFPNASQPGLTTLGPQWSAARSTHHRIAWLARESSKPQRSSVERWTVQASAEWSREHLADSDDRVTGKLLKAFAEVTGIRAEPAHAALHRWLYAKTETPLGQSHLWDRKLGLGVCGDWCIGHRVEDAFVSGLELALAVA
jgi:predicted NAD/FAD-dependent oxidoreductase